MKAEVQSKEMKKLDKIKRKSIKSLYDGGTPSLRGTLIKIIGHSRLQLHPDPVLRL